MRTFLSTVLVLVSLSFTAPPANASCLLCGAIGFGLGSFGSDQYGAAGGNTIYVAPNILERLIDDDPLAVRVKNSDRLWMEDDFGSRKGGATIREIFELTVDEPERYTILEVVRVIHPSSNNAATFWFTYIENEKLKPLSALIE